MTHSMSLQRLDALDFIPSDIMMQMFRKKTKRECDDDPSAAQVPHEYRAHGEQESTTWINAHLSSEGGLLADQSGDIGGDESDAMYSFLDGSDFDTSEFEPMQKIRKQKSTSSTHTAVI